MKKDSDSVSVVVLASLVRDSVGYNGKEWKGQSFGVGQPLYTATCSNHAFSFFEVGNEQCLV